MSEDESLYKNLLVGVYGAAAYDDYFGVAFFGATRVLLLVCLCWGKLSAGIVFSMDILELAADLFFRRIDYFIGAVTVAFVVFGEVFFSAFSACDAD